MVHALDLEVPRAGDVVGEIPAVLHRNDGVLAGMDDQGGRGERRQDRPHVDRNAASNDARAIPGLAHIRSNIASWRIDRTDGNADADCRTAAPRRADGAADFLQAGDLLHRRRVLLAQLGKAARPQLGRVAVDVVPPPPRYANVP